MIDHFMLPVRDYQKSRAFYEKALAPLGYVVVMEFGKWCGMGAGKVPDFWIGEAGQDPLPPPLHFAFASDDHAKVDAFYAAAMAAGGRDNGKPGIREQYHPRYYGAFVLDPDGHNIEAVCHRRT